MIPCRLFLFKPLYILMSSCCCLIIELLTHLAVKNSYSVILNLFQDLDACNR